jgi:anaerobic selenocysteine-containing dehydrogenase
MMGTNPLTTQTQSTKIRQALKEHMEFTLVSDIFMTPTTQLADLVLPAATWLEQDDVVYLCKIWCVLARKKLAQFAKARDDRDIIFHLAHRLSLYEAFPWNNSTEYLNWVLEDTGLNFEQFCERGIQPVINRWNPGNRFLFHTKTFCEGTIVARYGAISTQEVFNSGLLQVTS